MLPSAKSYLRKGGFSPEAAAFTLIGCFIGGVIGIQAISRLLHHYIPSHVVDCDHTHEERDTGESDQESHVGYKHSDEHIDDYEDTPLIEREAFHYKPNRSLSFNQITTEANWKTDRSNTTAPSARRPSLQTRFSKRVKTFITGAKASCDEGDPCYGYTDPCGQECFKAISRNPTYTSTKHSTHDNLRQPGLPRISTAPYTRATHASLQGLGEESDLESPLVVDRPQYDSHRHDVNRGRQYGTDRPSFESHGSPRSPTACSGSKGTENKRDYSPSPKDPSQAHHHHVPSNAFLSIGLQTSIAIALHKLPEGFITYATNHANPKLGFTVFMALFIHNITEGFAMALPLYLALGSRWKAMFWSSLLGGISQPLGAGIAALWFKLAGRSNMAPGENVYGGMFAVTAGIMTSVALQLFSESLTLTHNRNLCIGFAFIGMAILGVSFALTAT